jgi:hypothetical protein
LTVPTVVATPAADYLSVGPMEAARSRPLVFPHEPPRQAPRGLQDLLIDDDDEREGAERAGPDLSIGLNQKAGLAKWAAAWPRQRYSSFRPVESWS